MDGVDIFRALEHFGGDKKALVTVLRSFATNTRGLLVKLQEYLSAERLNDYAIVVHGIKSSSYGIFAGETGKLAEALEMKAKADDLAGVRAGHSPFEKTTAALLDNIEYTLSKIDTGADKPIAAKPDQALLEALRKACGDFDMDGVDAAIGKLEAFRYETGGGLVAWLREQVDSMAFEEISDREWPLG